MQKTERDVVGLDSTESRVWGREIERITERGHTPPVIAGGRECLEKNASTAIPINK